MAHEPERQPEQQRITALTPEEAALIYRIGVFVRMRWLAIAGVLIASTVATQVFHINFPLLPIFFICVLMALYNLFFYYQAKTLKAESTGTLAGNLTMPLKRLLTIPKATSPIVERAQATGNIHISVDLAVFIVLLHFTGGIENPFIFYFIFHVILAGILLHYRVAYLIATIATVMVILLVGLEYAGVIPHVHLEGFAPAGLYRDESYILAVIIALATCLYASAYMVTSISGELRKRQRQVVAFQQQGLREKTEELEVASKEVTKLEEGRKQLLRFLGIASHDLKAPLAAVQSYLQLMLKGFTGPLTDKQKQMVERSSIRITELLKLISDLLDISRIDAGQIVGEMEETSYAKVVEDAVETIRNQAAEKKIKLTSELPRQLPTLKASGARLKQVITNLLHNAVKFTPPEGMIKVRVSVRDDAIYTEVLDTGTGISAEDKPKLFQDFYRGSDKEKAGTGLGLSIARRIVEAHGGKIWVESPNPEDHEGRGSKFTFTLPLSLALSAEEAQPQALEKKEKLSG